LGDIPGDFHPAPRVRTHLAVKLSGQQEQIKRLGGSLAIATGPGIAVRAVVPAAER